MIVNRGGAADYLFTFDTEDGITATPGNDAEGTLEANSVTVISLKIDDLVTITGSHNRAAATLVVEAQVGDIDVLVSQTNMDGGTDTVTYTKTYNDSQSQLAVFISNVLMRGASAPLFFRAQSRR